MKKFTLLIMSTALLLFIAIGATQTNYNLDSVIAISAATDTGAGGGPFAIANTTTPTYATERPTILPLAGMRSDTPILAPDRYATGWDHRLSRKLDSHYIDYVLTAGANMDDTAPSTSTRTFHLRS